MRPTDFRHALHIQPVRFRYLLEQLVMIIARTRRIFHLVNCRVLMTHFMNERCRNLPDRAVELLRRHVQFVLALILAVLFPNLTDRPPTIRFVPLVRLYRYDGLYKFPAE